MLPTVLYLFPKNTQIVTITELQDQVTGQFLTNANVVATLYDRRGVRDSIFNNITMAFVLGSDATYQGQVPATFDARLGGGYKVVLIAEQGGVQAEFTISAIVQLRD